MGGSVKCATGGVHEVQLQVPEAERSGCVGVDWSYGFS